MTDKLGVHDYGVEGADWLMAYEVAVARNIGQVHICMA